MLAADVGGTKTAVALAAIGREWPGIIAEDVYSSQDFESFDAVIEDFLARSDVRAHAQSLAAACVCVAGPVESDCARTTNLRWTIHAGALAARFGIPEVRLINDFAAVAIGIERLEPHAFETLQQQVDGQPEGPRAVIGAGTGLGVAFMTWQDGEYRVHPSEGGHADFAPVDEVQDGLLYYLRRQYRRVSYERVLSGSGLAQVFQYLTTLDPCSPAMRAALEGAPDPAVVVSQFGLDRRDPVAVRALDVFAAVYGAFAGNIALTVLARGGVYIAGGIAPRIAAKLKDGTLVRAFNDKGRFAPLLSTIPLRIVMDPRVGLYGALHVASRLVRKSRKSGRRRPGR